jgi:hypothetical protein
VLDRSLLDSASLRTLSNKSAFDDVSPLTFDVSPLTFDMSSAFEDVSPALDDVSPLTFDMSPAFNDVSPLTLDMSPAFDDKSSAFDDRSAEMSLACPFIIPINSCRSDSKALLCGVVVSGVSVRRPGFEGTVGR